MIKQNRKKVKIISESVNSPEKCMVILFCWHHNEFSAVVYNVLIVTAEPLNFRFRATPISVAIKFKFLPLFGNCISRANCRLTRRPQDRESDIFMEPIGSGATVFDSTFVLAVVPVVGHVANFEVVNAFADICVDLVIGRQGGGPDGSVVVSVVRMRKPEACRSHRWRRKPTLQHNCGTLVRIYVHFLHSQRT